VLVARHWLASVIRDTGRTFSQKKKANAFALAFGLGAVTTCTQISPYLSQPDFGSKFLFR